MTNINTQSDIHNARIVGYGGLAALIILNIILIITGYEPQGIAFYLIETIGIGVYAWFANKIVTEAAEGGSDESRWAFLAEGIITFFLPFLFHALQADVVK